MSSKKFRALWLAALVAIPILVTPLGGASVAAANQALHDGGTYWQGTILTAGNAAAPGEPLTVNSTETGETELSLNADGDGDIRIDTSTLPGGEYNLTNSSGATLFGFEIAIQDLSATYEGLQLAYGGELKKAVIAVDSARGTFDVKLSSTAWSSDRTVEAHGGGDLTLNVSTLPDGPHVLTGEVVDTTASFTVTVDVSNPPSFEYVFPEREDRSIEPNDTHQFIDGETYWQGEELIWDSGTPELTFQVRTADEKQALVLERITNSTGHGVIDTSGLDGTYDIINSSSDETVGSFTVKVQTVTLELAAESQTLTQGETTTLTISTDRNGSNLALWSDKLTRDELDRAFPAAVHSSREVLLRNVSDGDQFTFETGHFAPGTYQIGAWSTDTDAQDRLAVVIEAPDTETSSVSSIGESGGGSSSSTSTATPQSTATLTPAATSTPEEEATPTPQPETVTVVKTVTRIVTVTRESSPASTPDEASAGTGTLADAATEAPGQPGFGFTVGIGSLLLMLLAAARRRWP